MSKSNDMMDAFSGERIHWKKFWHSLCNIARSAIPGKAHGVLGFILSEEEYKDLTGHKFKPLTDVSDLKPQLPGMSASEKEVERYKLEDKEWKFQDDQYVKQEAGLKILREWMWLNLDENSKRLFTQGSLGHMNFTTLEIVQRLKEEYATMMPSDMTKLMDTALSLFTGGNLRIWLLQLEATYSDLESHGERVDNAQKLRNLKNSLKNTPEYDGVILTWERKHITPSTQKEKWDTLLFKLKDEYDARQMGNGNNTTIQNRHMVNEVLSNDRYISANDVNKLIAAGIAAHISSTRPVGNTEYGNCKACGGKVTEKGKSGKINSYCTTCYTKHKTAKSST